MRRRCSIIFLLAALIGGCGPTPAPRNPNRISGGSDTPPPIRKAATGPVKIEQRGEDRRLRWVVHARASRLSYGGDQEMSGRLNEVRGELYRDGRPVSEFEAEVGAADQRARSLDLEGRVRIRAIGRDLVLSAERVRWLDDIGLIEASGAVTIRTSNYVVGPTPRLLATPDLSDVGTPDRFPEATR